MDQVQVGRRWGHPLPIRIMHWIGAAAVICMFLSGWAIYNASPSLPFTFPWGLTLGGWLAGGIAWHIAVMWVLFADGFACLAYGAISGHFWRDLRPTGLEAVHALCRSRAAGAGARLANVVLQMSSCKCPGFIAGDYHAASRRDVRVG